MAFARNLRNLGPPQGGGGMVVIQDAALLLRIKEEEAKKAAEAERQRGIRIAFETEEAAKRARAAEEAERQRLIKLAEEQRIQREREEAERQRQAAIRAAEEARIAEEVRLLQEKRIREEGPPPVQPQGRGAMVVSYSNIEEAKERELVRAAEIEKKKEGPVVIHNREEDRYRRGVVLVRNKEVRYDETSEPSTEAKRYALSLFRLDFITANVNIDINTVPDSKINEAYEVMKKGMMNKVLQGDDKQKLANWMSLRMDRKFVVFFGIYFTAFRNLYYDIGVKEDKPLDRQSIFDHYSGFVWGEYVRGFYGVPEVHDQSIAEWINANPILAIGAVVATAGVIYYISSAIAVGTPIISEVPGTIVGGEFVAGASPEMLAGGSGFLFETATMTPTGLIIPSAIGAAATIPMIGAVEEVGALSAITGGLSSVGETIGALVGIKESISALTGEKEVPVEEQVSIQEEKRPEFKEAGMSSNLILMSVVGVIALLAFGDD